MNPRLEATVVLYGLTALAMAAMYAGVAAIAAVIDGRRRARERREHQEADFWRTAHAERPIKARNLP